MINGFSPTSPISENPFPWDSRWEKFFTYLNTGGKVGTLFYPPTTAFETSNWTLVDGDLLKKNELGNSDKFLENLVRIYERVFFAFVYTRRPTTLLYQDNVAFLQRELIQVIKRVNPLNRETLVERTQRIFDVALGHASLDEI